jgi:hypothetical protein
MDKNRIKKIQALSLKGITKTTASRLTGVSIALIGYYERKGLYAFGRRTSLFDASIKKLGYADRDDYFLKNFNRTLRSMAKELKLTYQTIGFYRKQFNKKVREKAINQLNKESQPPDPKE